MTHIFTCKFFMWSDVHFCSNFMYSLIIVHFSHRVSVISFQFSLTFDFQLLDFIHRELYWQEESYGAIYVKE